MKRAATWAAVLCAAACAACTGEIADPVGGPGDRARGETVGPGAGIGDGDGGPTTRTDAAADERPFEAAPAALSRLTVNRYRNTLTDLLGDVVLPDDLEADTSLKGFTSIGAASVTIAPTTAEKFEDAALEVAQQVFADAAKRDALVQCTPKLDDDTCARSFVERFGKQAWRRPLTEDELAALGALSQEIGASLSDAWLGLEYTLAALLQSPHFLFRVDIGEVDPEQPDRRRYSAWEMASRLSYVLWDTTPDDELLAAAASGALTTLEGVRVQAQRMIDSPRFRPVLTRYFTENLALERLDTLSKDAATYPQMTETLPASMRGELTHLFDYVVFERRADVRDILNSPETFVNTELAGLYGVDADGLSSNASLADFVRVMTPSTRRGLLTSAGILATYANTTSTSPTRRGKFVRSRLLCDEIPPPPDDVVTQLPPPKPMQTMRQRLELHRTVKTCATCHVKMDPIGLALEHFDGIGAYREDDQGAALDVSGDIDGMMFDGAVGLADTLRDDPRVSDCLVQGLYRFALGHIDSPGEQVVLDELTDALIASGHRLPALMLAIVMSDGFRYVGSTE